MRYGICILPEYPWSEAASLWRRAEAYGFDHAWTYDHLVWGGLPGAPWHSTVATLTAAATVTDRVRLGTFVASPNFRHPVTFMRDVVTLDDVSRGRLLLGLGAGGDLDAGILGEQLTRRQRTDRFAEFVGLLDRLLTEDHVNHRGEYYAAVDARTLPGCVQRPRVPFVMAANGPRALRLAARHGQGWVTTGQ
ncbi:LLM class flavin-dependent oxidoreductase, partial [Ornithinicoccus halotolerans]|uniref:LLM class flavin-dependent oxidoreductase n=1 Tax=Ornithinicoccus halotolerans TaxID=1748220 RepID=UPI001295CD2D